MKAIRKLEVKYGDVMFRTGLAHLMDVGVRHLTDEIVEDNIRQILEEAETNKEATHLQIMTPEFKCEIIRCAADLAKFGVWPLIAYINEFVTVDNLMD